MNTEAQHQARN